MPQSNPVRYADANPEVRAVYDDIMATRTMDLYRQFTRKDNL